jgi:hypothetical protein
MAAVLEQNPKRNVGSLKGDLSNDSTIDLTLTLAGQLFKTSIRTAKSRFFPEWC